MADSLISIHALLSGVDPTSEADYILDSNYGGQQVVRRALDRIGSIASGVNRGKVTVRVDSSAAVNASGTITCVVASATAGDVLGIRVPGYPTFKLTAVNGSPTAADGEYDMSVATDTLFGDELEAAINAVPGLKDLVTASNSGGTVTVTATDLVDGVLGNSITFNKEVTTAAAHVLTNPTGGEDAGDQATGTCTINSDTAAIVEDDTVVIGSVTLTWKDAPSGEDEIDIANVDATDASALATAINDHSTLGSLLSASSAAGVVTVTYMGSPRAGALVTTSRTETNSGSVTWAAAALSSDSTEASAGTPAEYTFGGVT